MWPLDGLTCAIAVPTGLAAFNVGGVTIHRLFQLHEGKALAIGHFQKLLRYLRNPLFACKKDYHSLHGFQSHLSIHGLETGRTVWRWWVVWVKKYAVCRWFLQLQHVSDNPVSEKIATQSLLFKLGCAMSWHDSVLYDTLTINERQKKDQEFSSMLDCKRYGCPTDETLDMTNGCTANVRFAGFGPFSQIRSHMTAGLEAKFPLTVSARVSASQHWHQDWASAIGTVCAITVNRVTVQFDHISEPYHVEKVKSRFMVMKNVYVYRR